MRRNEFNNIEITNEKLTSGLEFGKTQKSETISQKENKLPEGELNEKYVGKTIRKQTEANIQYANKATAPVHGSTTVTSTATASNIAATTATVATAASVVAVTAISVGTGISVVLHDYDYKFNNFTVTSDSLSYELYVTDHNNERPDGEPYEEYDESEQEDIDEMSAAPFLLRVYNEYYDYSIPTYLDYNWGEFINLKPAQQYHIVLSENRFGGETIFDEQFATLKEETRVSEFRGISWDKTCNFLTTTMNVRLDYQDDFERFSDFKFHLRYDSLSETGTNEMVYELAKTTEEQEIKLDIYEDFSVDQTYDYSFTYMDEGVEITAETGIVQFEDNSGAKSEFNQFIFDKTANFINRTFEVQLDYVDDFNVYDNFVLSFFMKYEEDGATIVDEYGVDIPLQKTTEVQTVDLDGYEVILSEDYHYKLTCNYKNELTILDEGDVTFTDTSGAVNEFYGLIFDKKANFNTRTFEVQLDFKNDLGYLYNFEFTLNDLETGNERTYYLLEQTDVQTITVDEIEQGTEDDPVYLIDIVNHRMSYSFKYMNNDTECIVVEGEEFKFKNTLVSTFQGIETPYDFYAKTSDHPFTLPIKFLYDDAAYVYSGFYVAILLDNQDYAYLSFEGDTLTHDWLYGTVTSSTDGTFNQEDLIGAENVTIKVIVTKYNDDAEEDGGPDMIEEEVYSEENVQFTLNEKQTIYGGKVITDYIISGTYEIGIMPIYTGEPDDYVVYYIFECSNQNTYTCPVTLPNMGSYSYASLQTCEEGFDENNFMSDFSEPVKISIKFAKAQAGTVPDESDYTTMVVSESYQFDISA